MILESPLHHHDRHVIHHAGLVLRLRDKKFLIFANDVPWRLGVALDYLFVVNKHGFKLLVKKQLK